MGNGEASIVRQAVDRLEISTIDILKSIVDEVNIHGDVDSGSILNIPKTSYKIEVILFSEPEEGDINGIKQFIKSRLHKEETVAHWLDEPWIDEDGKKRKNKAWVDDEFEAYSHKTSISAPQNRLGRNQPTAMGTIITPPDDLGFFTIKRDYSNEVELGCVLQYHSAPSLYRGEI